MSGEMALDMVEKMKPTKPENYDEIVEPFIVEQLTAFMVADFAVSGVQIDICDDEDLDEVIENIDEMLSAFKDTIVTLRAYEIISDNGADTLTQVFSDGVGVLIDRGEQKRKIKQFPKRSKRKTDNVVH